MKPKVSIGLCAKNAESTIGFAIDSVMQQDFDHALMEIVFVDDGSDDATLQIMKKTISRVDFQVKIFSSTWQGIGKARNTVVENAEGEYIIWLDSDEILEKDFVRKQVRLMDLNPAAGIVMGKLGILPNANILLTLDHLPYIGAFATRDCNNPSKLPGTGGTTYRRSSVKEVGGFNEEFQGACEDTEVAFRMTNAGWVVICGEGLFYESHGQMTTLGTSWKRSVKRGMSSRKLYNKNNIFFSFYRINPFASFLVSIRYAVLGYLATKRKISFLLPLYYTFKNTAWFIGFTRSNSN
jgi:glycosyltransferase involved in cell wall biosynthesis